MKHRAYTLKGNTYSGPSSLTDIRTVYVLHQLHHSIEDDTEDRLVQLGTV
jgi:hypothetical protein